MLGRSYIDIFIQGVKEMKKEEKRLIVSMAVGERSRKFSEITFPLMQKYAQKCNADFIGVFNPIPGQPYPGHWKTRYKDFLSVYDRILHIDADTIVRENTPNLFDIVPKGMFGAVDELCCQDLAKESPAIDRKLDLELFNKKQAYCCLKSSDFSIYVNVGLFLFDKETSKALDFDVDDSDCYFREQTQLNFNLLKHKIYVYLLDFRFNFMSIVENKGFDKRSAYIIHYAGGYGGLTEDQIIEMMKKDLKN